MKDQPGVCRFRIWRGRAVHTLHLTFTVSGLASGGRQPSHIVRSGNGDRLITVENGPRPLYQCLDRAHGGHPFGHMVDTSPV